MTAAAPGAPRRRLIRGETRDAWIFITPALIGFLLFYILPAIRGIYFSFTDAGNLLKPEKLVGIKNYQKLIEDDVFWNALWVTLEYVVINIGIQTVIALLMAVLLDRLTRSTWIRAIVVFPWLLPNVIAAMVFLWLLDYNLGIVNALLDGLGLPRQAFWGNELWAIPTIALVNVWRHMGYTALLLFAGLQTIPKDVYEAGAIDGASELQLFRRVTLPLLRPVLALVMIVSIIGSFQIFDTVAVATNGGPVNATRVIYYYIVDQAFGRAHFGYGAAMAVVLMLILLAISIVQMRITRANQSDLA